jgi:hypothetical protein
MRTNQYDANLTPGDLVARRREKPMPSAAELRARNSFPSPDQNRHIDKFIKATKH